MAAAAGLLTPLVTHAMSSSYSMPHLYKSIKCTVCLAQSDGNLLLVPFLTLLTHICNV